MNNKTFTVIEYSSFYAIRHNESGKEHCIGDGVDSVFTPNGKAMRCGTERFRKIWEKSFNDCENDTMEAYFPELI